MDVLEAIVLGLVQGLTEFLPISSSAHLLIVPKLAGWGDPGAAFTAVIQLGTMLAVLIYFWRDIVRITWTWLRSLWTPELRGDLDARMGWYIGLGTIPIGVAGLLFKDAIEGPARNLWLNASMLIVFGLLLLVADQMGRGKKEVADLNMRDGLIIGAWQMLPLIPGASRSGSTMTGAMFLGYTREAAARYSFLLSIPAVILSGLFELRHVGDGGGPPVTPTVIATVVSFVVGYASIAWLLRYVARHSTIVFVVYRVFAGAFLLTLLALGVVQS
ncbi:undecaprenyl-diphosphatase 2 [Microbispora rosea subsp. aerata]|nr:undecaprenyl-diphosphate phosphatase [Microbispora rosea]GGO23712.1 undecaprenyl-diphosphatase 2 [Microbispora rosea subsp. aerata]GIH57793.1 undecaprenyl-diphosphatase 2 [Microbispora rosea subsp. aerata]GLJ84489.1 undecaprenyl-diphosphatase 2 [Microbispora rosea subsp. aerata]